MILRITFVLAFLVLVLLYAAADADFVRARSDFGESTRETAELLVSEAERMETELYDPLASVRLAEEARDRVSLTEKSDPLSARFRARADGQLRKLAVLSPLEKTENFAPDFDKKTSVRRLATSTQSGVAAVVFNSVEGLTVIDPSSSRPITLAPPDGAQDLKALAVSTSGRMVVAGYDDSIFLWDDLGADEPTAARRIDAAEGTPSGFAFSQDDQYILAAFAGGKFRAYKVTRSAGAVGAERLGDADCDLGFTSSPHTLLIDSAGERVIVAAATRTAAGPSIFEADKGQDVAACPFRRLDIRIEAANSPAGSAPAAQLYANRHDALLSAGAGRFVTCCRRAANVTTSAYVLTLGPDAVTARELSFAASGGLQNWQPNRVAVSSDGSRIAAVGPSPGRPSEAKAVIAGIDGGDLVDFDIDLNGRVTGPTGIFAFSGVSDARSDFLLFARGPELQVWSVGDAGKRPKLVRRLSHGERRPIVAALRAGAAGEDRGIGQSLKSHQLQTIDDFGVRRTWSLAPVSNELAQYRGANIQQADLGFGKSSDLIIVRSAGAPEIALLREVNGVITKAGGVTPSMPKPAGANFAGDGSTVFVVGFEENGDIAIETFRLRESAGGKVEAVKSGARRARGEFRWFSASSGFAMIDVNTDETTTTEIWDLLSTEPALAAIPAPKLPDAKRGPVMFFSSDRNWAVSVDRGADGKQYVIRANIAAALRGATDYFETMIYGEGALWQEAIARKTILWSPSMNKEYEDPDGRDLKKDLEAAQNFGELFSFGIVDASPLAILRDDAGNIVLFDIETGAAPVIARLPYLPEYLVSKDEWDRDDDTRKIAAEILKLVIVGGTKVAGTSQTIVEHGKIAFRDPSGHLHLLSYDRTCREKKPDSLCLEAGLLDIPKNVDISSLSILGLSPRGKLLFGYGGSRLVAWDLEVGVIVLDAEHETPLQRVQMDDAEERFLFLDRQNALSIIAWLSAEDIKPKRREMETILPDKRALWNAYRMQERDVCYSGQSRPMNPFLRAGHRLWGQAAYAGRWAWIKARDWKAEVPSRGCAFADAPNSGESQETGVESSGEAPV